MGRLCERPGCSEVGVIGFGFDADRLLVWLTLRDPAVARDDMRSGSLCLRHADAMVVPLGWTLDDRRDPTPRLFRPKPPGERVAPTKRRRRSRATRPAPEASVVATLPLDPAIAGTTVDVVVAGTIVAVEAPAVQTVASVTGAASTTDDPDATVAIPWMPQFDIEDDLGGVLRAESPLLARAFRGRNRPR